MTSLTDSEVVIQRGTWNIQQRDNIRRRKKDII